jgi:mono/diheme cytochrome c family protein
MKSIRLAAVAVFVMVVGAVQTTTTSVWDGVYTADQAKRGADAYTKNCASCHGDQLEGAGQAPGLTGDDFMGAWNKQVADDLFEIIAATMPADKPGSLSRAQNADILSYIFKSNGFPAGKAELPPDAESLKKIRIEAKK